MEIITPLSKMLRSREISSVELTQLYLSAIEKENEKYNAFVSVNFEKALESAKKADEMIENGEGSRLCGIPMALKDNICSRGDLTTCASKMLESYRPFYSATAYEKLEAQGAVLLGKTNMDEFAMGSTGENSIYGAAKNPRNTNYVTGGSSSGGAAAVCAGLAPYCLGSDTGGSVRQPAAFCGVVGLKPTYGAVSRYGLIAHASSLDQIGVLASSVKDSAIVLEAISGRDKRDMTSADCDFGGVSDSLDSYDVKGLKIGIAKEYTSGADIEVRDAVKETAEFFEANGAKLVEISLPDMKEILAAYYIIACAEASSNLGRYDGVRFGHRAENAKDAQELIIKSRTEGFGNEVKRRIMLGTYVLSSGYYDAYYKKARMLRNKVCEEFRTILEKCQIVLAPTAPSAAFETGKESKSPVDIYLSDIMTVPVNIAGLPAISVPVKNTENGLPLGVQLIGKSFSEKDILGAAYFFEKNRGGIPEVKGGVRLV